MSHVAKYRCTVRASPGLNFTTHCSSHQGCWKESKIVYLLTSCWSVALHPLCDLDSIPGDITDYASIGINKLLARSCRSRQTQNEVAFRDSASACASHPKIHVWLPYHWPLHRFRNGAIKFGATINPNVAHFKPGWHRVLQLLPLPAKAITKCIPAPACHSSAPGKRLLPCRSIRRNRTFQTT
jgi:hypothetical protein